MNKAISLQLTNLCDTIPAKLKLITEEEFGSKPFATKWSKKELLGHLIDSAANNHQRFVRAQFEVPVVYYNQDLWVNLQQFQHWRLFVHHLSQLLNS